MKEINNTNKEKKQSGVLQKLHVAENSFMDRTGRVIAVSMIVGFTMLGSNIRAEEQNNEITEDVAIVEEMNDDAVIVNANVTCLFLTDLTLCDDFTICNFCLFNNNPI